MVVLNSFEASEQKLVPGDLTLISSLEPCPMCMTRLIFSGIGNIRYVCRDDVGGMVQRKHQLPPVFLDITEKQGQEWSKAKCSAALEQAAYDIWHESQEDIDKKVVERGTGVAPGSEP